MRVQAYDIFKLIIIVILATIAIMTGLSFLKKTPWQHELKIVNQTFEKI